RYERVNLATLVRRTSSAFASLAVERDITYACTAPPGLWAEVDADKIELVLLKLLFNAFKYTPPGGRIECALVQLDSGEVTLRVGDTGRSISRTQAAAIFDRARPIDRGGVPCVQSFACDLG